MNSESFVQNQDAALPRWQQRRDVSSLPVAALLLSLAITLGGCAVAPKQLIINELAQPQPAGTIISAEKKSPVTKADLIADLESATVVYVGEKHTDPEHHRIQLDLLRTLHSTESGISVGMEMFDRTYQPVLDRWSAGELSSTEFLEQVQWYANWRYNFKYYREILEYIKAQQIPLVALNLPSYIPPRIRVGGIDNLQSADRRHLPAKITGDDSAHRAYIENIFKQHHFGPKTKFDYFYAAQNVWEDIMAESIVAHLQKKEGGVPGKMIVFLGNGHIIHKFGVPDRAHRRMPVPFRTLYLAPAAGEVDLSYGDYIWVTPKDNKSH